MDLFENINVLRKFRKDIEDIRRIRLRTSRQTKFYRPRINPMKELSEKEFKEKYRFKKDNILKIVDILKNDLDVDRRGGSIPLELQIMAVIRYWGRHEIQEDCADTHGMSQQTLSRLCSKVAVALASKSESYIKMPSNMLEETQAIKKFEAICGFPYIIGVIDETHIKIQKVSADSNQYYIMNKGHYSINTQIVCDADLKICDIVCHLRNSANNARIFSKSSLKQRFENYEFRGKLLGNSGYPCTPYLLTPVLEPKTESERCYNHKHIQTRNTIERCFGLWKKRFRILLEVMRGSLTNINTTIIACAVLHNLAIEFNDYLDNDPIINIGEEDVADSEDIEQNQNNMSNICSRSSFIENFFVTNN